MKLQSQAHALNSMILKSGEIKSVDKKVEKSEEKSEKDKENV